MFEIRYHDYLTKNETGEDRIVLIRDMEGIKSECLCREELVGGSRG